MIVGIPATAPGAIGSAMLLALEHPRSWLIALAAFLVRGGILLFLLPVVVLPTATGLGNMLGPDLTSFVFGGISLRLIAIAAAVAIGFAIWAAGGGLAAAAAELELIRIALLAEADGGDLPPSLTEASRVLLARTICHLPFALAVAGGAVRLISATYNELIRPGDLTEPTVVRIVAAVPDVLVALLLTWLVGQLLGALAARRLAIHGGPALRAVGWAVARAVTQPVSTIVAFLLPLIVSYAVIAPLLVGAALAWRAVGEMLRRDLELSVVLAGLGLFLAIWTSGLLFAGLAAAWRSFALTLEVIRVDVTRP